MKNPKTLSATRGRLLGGAHLLGGKELIRLMALTAWISEALAKSARLLIVLEHHLDGLEQWLVVKRTRTKGARVRLVVEPTKAARYLMAAGLAACQNKRGIKHAARTKQLLKFLGSDVWNVHDRATSPNAKVSDGNQPPLTFDLSLSESAGSRSLHRLVRYCP